MCLMIQTRFEKLKLCAADVVEAATGASSGATVDVPDGAVPVSAGAVAVLLESPVPVVAGVTKP